MRYKESAEIGGVVAQREQPPVQSNINYHQNKYSIEMMSVGGDIVGGGATGSNMAAVPAAATSHDQSQQMSLPVAATQNPIQSKMSDILKRKAPPKRKSQTSSRTKTRNQDHHSEQSSSVMQELMNKATALGKETKHFSFVSVLMENLFAGSSGRSTPSSSSSTPLNAGASGSGSSGSSSSRSRFGSNSKTSSFLASLNPANGKLLLSDLV